MIFLKTSENISIFIYLEQTKLLLNAFWKWVRPYFRSYSNWFLWTRKCFSSYYLFIRKKLFPELLFILYLWQTHYLPQSVCKRKTINMEKSTRQHHCKPIYRTYRGHMRISSYSLSMISPNWHHHWFHSYIHRWKITPQTLPWVVPYPDKKNYLLAITITR